MKNKELKIEVPEGYCIDTKNSTFECIRFKPKEALSYEDVIEKLFKEGYFYIDSCGAISHTKEPLESYKYDINNASSAEQLKKLLAINKLMTVAKYLNDGWKPNWKTTEDKFCITLRDDHIEVVCVNTCCGIEVHFKSEGLAMQAVDILGEKTIRLALSTDWLDESEELKNRRDS